jgi:hypothetical protein
MTKKSVLSPPGKSQVSRLKAPNAKINPAQTDRGYLGPKRWLTPR